MYCNITTDLRDVFPKVGNYQGKKLLERWVAVSGQANTYLAEAVGYVENIFDDGAQLTVKTSIADVQSNAGSYYYVADTDLLYVHTVGSDNLTAASIPKIESGVDWDAFKLRMRNDAAEEMDSYLNRLFATPLLPRLIKRHSSNDYESTIRLSCAYLTCRNIVRRLSPSDSVANDLEKKAINSNTEDGDPLGMIDRIIKGEIVLQEQISPREVGKFNVDADSSNSGTGYIWLLGTFTGANYERWRLEIDKNGAPGTATYKLSYDGGTNWDVENKETFNADSNNRRIHIGRGIEVVFYGTFVDDDKWDIEVFPLTDVPERAMISSSKLVRE